MPGTEHRFVQGSEPVFLGGDSRVKTLHSRVFLGITRRGQGNIVMAARREIGAQDIGPIAAAGPQFNHRRRGRRPEECHFRDRGTRGIPSQRGGAACGAGDGANEGRVRVRNVGVRGNRRSGESQDREQSYRERCMEAGICHGHTSVGAFIEPHYHKFADAGSQYRRRRPQFGGVSPVKGIGVAPLTVPMVALSLTYSCTLRSKRSSPWTVAPGPITIRGMSRFVSTTSPDGCFTRIPPSTCDAPVMFILPLMVLIPPATCAPVSVISPLTFEIAPATSEPSPKVSSPLTEATLPDTCAPAPSDMAPFTLARDVPVA